MIGGMLAKVSTLLISVGLLPQATGGRIRRTRHGLPALAFDRSDERGFFTADISPGADAQIDPELEVAFEHAPAQQAFALGLLDGGLQALDRQRRFAAHVDVALLRADRAAGDCHPFEHAVRIAFEHAAIHERARDRPRRRCRPHTWFGAGCRATNSHFRPVG